MVDEATEQYNAVDSITISYEQIKRQIHIIKQKDQFLPEAGQLYPYIEKLDLAIDHLFLGEEGSRWGVDYPTAIKVLNEAAISKADVRRLYAMFVSALIPNFQDILTPVDSIRIEIPENLYFVPKILKDHHGFGAYTHEDWVELATGSRKKFDDVLNGAWCAGYSKIKANLADWNNTQGRKIRKEYYGQKRRNGSMEHIFAEDALEHNKEALAKLPGLGFLNVLNALTTEHSSIRLEGSPGSSRKMVITTLDKKHIRKLKECHTTWYMDASMDIPSTSKLIDPKNMLGSLWVEEVQPSHDNLTITSVNIKGVGSTDLSKSAAKRMDAAIATLQTNHRHDTVSILGKKKWGDQFYWFKDNFRTNVFKNQGVNTLICKGAPFMHLGAAYDEYRAIYGAEADLDIDEEGNNRGFQKFYQRKVSAQIIQLSGRLRHQWQGDRQFNIYVLASNLDLSFLTNDYGIRTQHINGMELCPNAGSESELAWHKVKEMGKVIFSESGDPRRVSQAEIAERLNMSQGRVSQLAKQFADTWSEAKLELLASLVDPYREINISPTHKIPIATQLSLQTLSPKDAIIEELGAHLRSLEAYGFEEWYGCLHPADKARFIPIMELLLHGEVALDEGMSSHSFDPFASAITITNNAPPPTSGDRLLSKYETAAIAHQQGNSIPMILLKTAFSCEAIASKIETFKLYKSKQ